MRVPVHGSLIGEEEKAAARAVADAGWFTYGKHCQGFERKLETYTGKRDAIVCNSGSSANLLAFSALELPPGSEVITCAVGFPTTVNPIIQGGCTPVWVDCELPSMEPTLDAIEAAITPRTRAVMLAHTLGMPLPEGLRELCDARGLFLIDDCCDALGSPRTMIGDLSTLSFFPAHQVCAGEGGAVLVDSPKLAKVVRSYRDWGRDCWCEPGTDNTCGRRFAGEYDHKYTYSRIGYHLAMTEFQGAIGSVQMDRLFDFVSLRATNHAFLNMLMTKAGMDEYFILPPDVFASWFGYALICKSPVSRNAITQWLEAKGVQTRVVFGGNLLRQPAYAGFDAGPMPNADIVHDSAFWVGCWPGLGPEQLEYTVNSIVEYCKGIA